VKAESSRYGKPYYTFISVQTNRLIGKIYTCALFHSDWNYATKTFPNCLIILYYAAF